VVAQAGAVGRRVILAEDLERRATARRLERARDHVDFRRMILAELAIRIGAGGIEVAEPDRADAVRPLEMRQRVFYGELRLATGVDRRRRMRLTNRRLYGLAVDGARRREAELPALLRRHRLERRQRTADVVA